MRGRALILAAAIAWIPLAVLPAMAEPQDSRDAPHAVRDSGGAFSGAKAHAYLTPVQSAAFAKQVERDLATRGARMAIVFRTGRPRKDLPEGIRYTHAAFWVYGDIKGGDGRLYKGYSVYNLYQGDGADLPRDRSYLAQDFPVDFIAGSQADDVAVIVPSPEMQRRISAVIQTPQYERLHVDDYSVVSNPLDPHYQNCTEFVLDVISAAAWQTTDYAQIKADLTAHFHPTIVKVNGFQRFFGPMVDNAVKMDDQSGPIITAEYGSIARFMTDNKLIDQTYVLNRTK